MKKPVLEIFIPVHNNSSDIEKNMGVLASFCQKHMKKYNYSIIIADNGSTDNTKMVAGQIISAVPKVKYYYMPFSGRGRALRHCWSRSNADYVCYMDVDLATDLSALPPLIDALAQGYDISVGSKYIKNAERKRNIVRLIASKGFNLLTKIALLTTFTDAQCGFKAVNKDVAARVVPLTIDNNWFFDTELLYLCEKGGFSRKEIPVVWRESSKSSVKLIKTCIRFLINLAKLRLRKIKTFK